MNCGTLPDLPTLIDALSTPAPYPHPVHDLHVLQTHASCVFLTGEFVYKIKKPVNFGFLDYSTPEQRRKCCERELELNCRLCPEVYLDLVPIGWEAGRLRVGVSGAPVEWAVRMRQLPEEDMLPARLSAGTVTPEQIARLAEVLSSFHAEAATNPETAAFGTPEAVWRNVDENFTQTAYRTGEWLPPEHLTTIREYSGRFLAEQRDLFLARMAEGRIRDGHGDLRAQNICLYEALQGGIQILDCIEFNDRFRFGDVAADLAYLAMDLDLAGRADLRQALIDRYVERSEDVSLRRLLPFYCCYRAYVRGKIALLTAEESEIPPAECRKQGDLAAAAFDLSRSYAARRERPILLVTVGYSGSGKSVLAHELARRLPAMRLASDALRKELAGVADESRLGAEHYTPEAKRRIYQELQSRARAILAQREHVILDATFLDPEEREQVAALAKEQVAEFWAIACVCPDAVIRERLRHRSKAAELSDATLAVYEAQRREFASIDSLAPKNSAVCWVTVRTDQRPYLAARQAMQEIWR